MLCKDLTALFTLTLLYARFALGYNGSQARTRSQLGQFSLLAEHSQTSSNSSSECTSKSCYRYYSNNTEPYLIQSLPEVDFAIGELYGGSVPIKSSDPSRTIYYVFKPAIDGPVDELTIYLNGGPGCSSLTGFLQENGPILWLPGTQQPVQNPYTWAKTTNMLWVDQPVGTGFSGGNVTATNEVDIAVDFVGFLKNWQELFGIKNYKIYLSGESYAGRYVPYIGAQMLDQNDTEYFAFSGALIYDPYIGDAAGAGYVQMGIPTPQFLLENNAIFTLNSSLLEAIEEFGTRCGYTEYLDKYLTFPPPGHQPNKEPRNGAPGKCDAVSLYNNAIALNPCFNIYHVVDYCPQLSNVLGGPSNLYSKSTYFNRQDVKQAIHAPLDVTWYPCAKKEVFHQGEDTSDYSIVQALPRIIEATNRVLIANGDWDGLVFTNGTLLTIQNMTWNGKLGFQSAPTTPLYIAGQGVMGKTHYERGLQWAETYQCGHMQPQYQPLVSYTHLEWLLGRISSLPTSGGK